MLDLELLRSFVSVVDSGGFTRAGERVHRTQSTVSQQIKRLEDDVGQPLLNRNGKDVTPTEAGERLLSYARRLLSLAEEARDVVARPESEGAVRLGIPEDFAAYRLAKLLATFSRSRPGLRLDVRADQSAYLQARSRTRRTRSGVAQARRRRERRHRSVAGARALGHQQEPSASIRARLGAADRFSRRLPLSRARDPCARKRRARWHMAYTSSDLAGIQAAVAAGTGPEHSLRDRDPGRPSRADGEGWLCADRQDGSGADGPDASPRRCGWRTGCEFCERAGEGGVARRALALLRGEGWGGACRSTQSSDSPTSAKRVASQAGRCKSSLNNSATRRWRAACCRRAHAP